MIISPNQLPNWVWFFYYIKRFNLTNCLLDPFTRQVSILEGPQLLNQTVFSFLFFIFWFYNIVTELDENFRGVYPNLFKQINNIHILKKIKSKILVEVRWSFLFLFLFSLEQIRKTIKL